MALKNGDTISTGQVVNYRNASNVCQQHCMDNKDNNVCGKGELCCNVTKEVTNNTKSLANEVLIHKKTLN